jgi:hypothetical protein
LAAHRIRENEIPCSLQADRCVGQRSDVASIPAAGKKILAEQLKFVKPNKTKKTIEIAVTENLPG